MIDKNKTLSDKHWDNEEFKQRLTIKEWRELLLHNDDYLIFQGKYRQLIAKNLGFGVVEVFKQPLEEDL